MNRFILMIALLLGACASPRLMLSDHPLAGRIWDPGANRFVGEDEVAGRIDASDIVLLGETHDNPAHHEIQLRLLEKAASRRRPALALEPIDSEHQAAIDAARDSAEAIAKAGKVASSWEWNLYAPLVSFALVRGLPIVAANLSRPRAREIGAQGLESLGAQEPRRLALETTWNAQRNATLRKILMDAHCGKDFPHIDGMIVSQRARDAVMADRILARAPVVAIIGRGHARKDFGVPIYLAQRAPGRKVLSIGLVEVQEKVARPADYDEAAPDVHDLVWFTPRAERKDPC